MQHNLLVSSYTKNLKDEGIKLYQNNTQLKAWNDIENPSWITLNQIIYTVSEGQHGRVYKIFKDGKKKFVNVGADPCHLLQVNDKIWVANYSSGQIFILDLDLNVVKMIQHEGKSIHERQEAAHVHSCTLFPSHLTPNGPLILVCDLGGDTLYVYNQHGILITATTSLASTLNFQDKQVPNGAGPRHACFHPSLPLVYVAHELTSTLGVYKWSDRLQLLSNTLTIPKQDSENTLSEIKLHPTLPILYTANRGHDSIAVLSISNPESPILLQTVQVGKCPRHFTLNSSGSHVYVALQVGGQVVGLQVLKDGRLGIIELVIPFPGASCIISDPIL